MCMEDIILGRATRTTEHIRSLTNASTPVIDYSNRRIKLTIYPPPSGTLTLSIKSPAVANKGIILLSTSMPLVMTVETHGDIVTKQWYGIHSAGGVTFTYYDGELEK